MGVIDNGIVYIKYLVFWIKRVYIRFLKKDISVIYGIFVLGIVLYGDKLENREMVKNEGFYFLDVIVLLVIIIEEDDLL